MDTSQTPADRRPEEFRDADLRGARFVDPDLWLGQAVLGAERPFHPLGLANPQAADEWEHHRYAVRDLDALTAARADVENTDPAPSTG